MICADCKGELVFGPSLKESKVTECSKEGQRTFTEHRCEHCAARQVYDFFSDEHDCSAQVWAYSFTQDIHRALRYRQ